MCFIGIIPTQSRFVNGRPLFSVKRQLPHGIVNGSVVIMPIISDICGAARERAKAPESSLPPGAFDSVARHFAACSALYSLIGV